MNLKWEQDFVIHVRAEGNEVILSANRAGLISLANHLSALAEESPGTHLHLDAYNALEDGSAELILEKISF